MEYSLTDLRKQIDENENVTVGPSYNQPDNIVEFNVPGQLRWHTCREETFADAQNIWKGNPKEELENKRFLMQFSLRLPRGEVTEAFKRKMAEKIHAVHVELLKAEEHLHFARHTLKLIGIRKPPNASIISTWYTPFTWEVNVSNRWRFSPTNFFLLLYLLRSTYDFDSFKKLPEVKLIAEHDVRPVFGKSYLHRLSKGHMHATNQGNIAFRNGKMKDVQARLKKEAKEAAEAAKKVAKETKKAAKAAAKAKAG